MLITANIPVILSHKQHFNPGKIRFFFPILAFYVKMIMIKNKPKNIFGFGGKMCCSWCFSLNIRKSCINILLFSLKMLTFRLEFEMTKYLGSICHKTQGGIISSKTTNNQKEMLKVDEKLFQ